MRLFAINISLPVLFRFFAKPGRYACIVLFCLRLVTGHHLYAQPGADRATMQDSMELYNNARLVQDFYERSGMYTKTHERPISASDPAKLHVGNDKKYAEVLSTINKERLTPTGKRKIRIEEYRINISKYKYKQRELSDYVLNTDAPMQLFDRRIAPQAIADYLFVGDNSSPINADDVDFKIYDPIAIKPYSKLTPEEKLIRDSRYPASAKVVPAPTIVKVAKEKNGTDKKAKSGGKSVYIISGNVPDSVRFKRFISRHEAEEFIKTLPDTDDTD